jgi:hypothetical protein
MNVRRSRLDTNIDNNMAKQEINAKWSTPLFLMLSMVVSFAVACLAFYIIGQCPMTPAGVQTLAKTWPWAGQACTHANGDGGIIYIFCAILFFVIQSTVSISILFSHKANADGKYIRVAGLAIVFLVLYMLAFVF